tara:strand:- start:714 stop:1871 length:1158 start_codon:yes stop_codon:yes gene_type:complete
MITQGLILCGGHGTRLGNITKRVPKPLIKVNNFTVVEHIIKNLSRFGINQIFLLCYYKFELFKKKFHKKKYFGVEIRCIKEKKLLGSSGALFNVRKKLHRHFLMCNGDTFFDINISDLAYEYFNKKAIAFLALKKLNDDKRYDQFRITKNGKLSIDVKKKSKLINSGIYILSKKIVPYLVKFGSLEKEVFMKLPKNKIFGKRYNSRFLDMGIKKDLNKLPKFLNFINFKPCLFLDRDGVINKDNGYVFQKEKFVWRKNIFKYVKKYNDNNYLVIIITNQSGIGRGFYKESDVKKLHNWMVNKFRSNGANIDKIYYAPYFKDSKIYKYRLKKNLRKPSIGMIQEAKKDFNIKMNQSILIGDSETDKQTAINANIKFRILSFESKLI